MDPESALQPNIVAPVADTRYGKVRGDWEGDTLVWRGVPYAQARRFARPLPPQPWEDIRDCLVPGPIAPQGTDTRIPLGPELAVGEDCLWLNVWAPPEFAEPNPVLVWIHGGAYCLGTAAQPIYNGRNLSELGDVVVVTVNYRLGAFGFLDLTSLPGEFESNLGLRDVLCALEWVRDNIAGFGGDPDNVTVFGESSGAGCITTLLTVPAAAGLFHRAIVESPPATAVYGPERAAGIARRFLEKLEIAPQDAAALHEVELDRLIAASDALVDEVPAKTPGTLAMAPVVDGELVPRYPVAAFQQGLSHRVPLIIGSNSDEASLFRFIGSVIMPVTPDAITAMFRKISVEHPDLSAERIAEIVSAYPDVDTAKGAMALSTDAAFRMPSLWIAEAHSRHSPTFLYRFDHATPILRAAGIGAGHATELPYVFGNFGSFEYDPTFWLGGRKAAVEVSGRVQRRWLAFARHGVPAALDGSKHWAPYTETERLTLLIDTTDTLATDPDKEFREAWGEEPMAFS